MYRINLDKIPYVNFSGRVKQVTGRWTHGGIRHINNDILVVMLDGKCEFNFVDTGESRLLKRGEATIILHGNYYTGKCKNDCEYYFFHLPHIVSEVTEDEVRTTLESADKTPYISGHYRRSDDKLNDFLFMYQVTDISPVMKEIVSLLSKCDLELTKTDVNRGLRFNLHLCQLLTQICEQAMCGFAVQASYPAALDRILTYIYEHYTEPLTLESLSHRFGLSKQYIIRLFKTHLGTTVTRFINNLKLSHAPELLTGSTLNISEISAYLGFSSAGYFSRLFRAKYSVSPREFI